MLKAREILKLKYEANLSLREIASATNVGKSTVSEILNKAKESDCTWPTNLTDMALTRLLYPPKESTNTTPEPDMNYVFREMKKKGVTLLLLWEEYKQQHPDGFMYTQFCDRYRQFKANNKLVLHIEHTAGEEMQVDWAGSTIPYRIASTGLVKDAYIFVAVLPASSYVFIYAYPDMQIGSWINAHIRAYSYFGGVPKITIPDNTKTAVTKTHLFQPTLNRSYKEMATHYRTTIIPARVYKPKDKASVENGVGNITRRVLAPLRNQTFFSLTEINTAITTELRAFVVRPFQRMEGNRQLLFEQIDKPALMPLPESRYEYADWKEAKVGFNYHVEYNKHHYSVPYQHIGQNCHVRATVTTIEIYSGTERLAVHSRNNDPWQRYTTVPEHMPDNHKVVSKWNTEAFLSWAGKVGPHMREFMETLLQSREYPVQAYKAALSVMSLTKAYPPAVMEKASVEAIATHTVSYKYFTLIVQKLSKETADQPEKIIENTNVRGKGSFAKGGIYVN